MENADVVKSVTTRPGSRDGMAGVHVTESLHHRRFTTRRNDVTVRCRTPRKERGGGSGHLPLAPVGVSNRRRRPADRGHRGVGAPRPEWRADVCRTLLNVRPSFLRFCRKAPRIGDTTSSRLGRGCPVRYTGFIDLSFVRAAPNHARRADVAGRFQVSPSELDGTDEVAVVVHDTGLTPS